jgi:hypothetical protein
MRRLVLAGMLAAVAVVVMPSVLAVEAAAPVTFDSYAASAESWGLDIRVVAIPVKEEIPDLVDEYFPHTFATVDSLPHAAADGEFFDPGGTVRVGPGLANGVLLGPHGVPPIVPKYPYVASATSDANSKRDVSAGTTQAFTPEPGILPLTVPGLPVPTGFGAGVSHAHADPSPLADATGTVAGVDLGLVKIGSVSGESTAQQAKGVVSTTTSSAMGDITIAAVLHIAHASLTATVQTSGPNTVKTAQTMTYDGVTLAGIPATIDQNGLHIEGTGIAADAAAAALQQLNGVLSAAHAQLIAPAAAGTTKPDGSATSSVAGLGIDITDGANYDAQITLGRADLSVRARPSLPVVSLPLQVTPQQLTPVVPALPIDTAPLPAAPVAAAPVAAPAAPARQPVTSVRRALPATIELASSGTRRLILPFVAVFAELSLLLLCIQAYRWKRAGAVESPEDLLAL